LKIIRPVILLICAVAFTFKLTSQIINTDYDSTLAKSLEADDYGMKSYILVILKTGTNNLEKGQKRDSLFAGHRNNIKHLAELGKLVIAGPLGDNDKSYRGIFIFNVKTIGEARELLETDPTIKAKVLDAELYEWYGSAAISEYLKVHRKIAKQKF
jgi:uncharacterized protein